jgi:hypothetical protein
MPNCRAKSAVALLANLSFDFAAIMPVVSNEGGLVYSNDLYQSTTLDRPIIVSPQGHICHWTFASGPFRTEAVSIRFTQVCKRARPATSVLAAASSRILIGGNHPKDIRVRIAAPGQGRRRYWFEDWQEYPFTDDMKS